MTARTRPPAVTPRPGRGDRPSSWLVSQVVALVVVYLSVRGMGLLTTYLHDEPRTYAPLLDPYAWLTTVALVGAASVASRLTPVPPSPSSAGADPTFGRSDVARFLRTLRRERRAGSSEAAFTLAKLYLAGRFVTRDEARAFSLLSEAARGDHPVALHRFALCHERGWLTSRDPVVAYRLYLRSALFGCAEAMDDVARCLEHGLGATRDPAAARVWRDARRDGTSGP